LRPTERARIVDSDAAGAAGRDCATRDILKTRQQLRQSLLAPRLGGKVDAEQPVRVGRSLHELNIGMAPAYLLHDLRVIGTGDWKLARAAGQQNRDTRESEPTSLGALRIRVRWADSGFGGAAGPGIFAHRAEDLDLAISVQQQRVVKRENEVVVVGKFSRSSGRPGGGGWRDVPSRCANLWMNRARTASGRLL
jgi:hypothetical protein